jgi:hypothetical protein
MCRHPITTARDGGPLLIELVIVVARTRPPAPLPAASSENQAPIVRARYLADLPGCADRITSVGDDPQLFAPHAFIRQSQTCYLDATGLSADKSDGIRELTTALVVSLDNVAAIRDQANDLPMR